MNDTNIKDKINEADQSTLLAKIDEVASWVDANEHAEIEEYEEKKKELENIANPIMTKIYSDGAGAGAGNMGGEANTNGPNVQEVD